MTAGADVVCVLVTESGSGIGEVIALELGDRGAQVIRHSAECPADRPCVAVISSRSLHDTSWIDATSLHEGARFIAVRFDELSDDDDIPESLAELNWLAWDPLAAENFHEQLYGVCCVGRPGARVTLIR